MVSPQNRNQIDVQAFQVKLETSIHTNVYQFGDATQPLCSHDDAPTFTRTLEIPLL